MAPRRSEIADDLPRDLQRMRVILSAMIGNARPAAVNVGAAELLGGHNFARRGFDERRTRQEYRAFVAHDNRFIAHRRNIGAAGGARTHDDGDLRDAARRHRGLIVKDPAEMIPVGKNILLARQIGAA